MSPCTRMAEWIPLYIDNELAASDMPLLETHLTECHACRDRFDQLRAVVDNIRAATPLYEPSPGSVKRIRAMVLARTRACGGDGSSRRQLRS